MMRIQAAFEAGIAAHWLHLGLVTARRTSQFVWLVASQPVSIAAPSWREISICL